MDFSRPAAECDAQGLEGSIAQTQGAARRVGEAPVARPGLGGAAFGGLLPGSGSSGGGPRAAGGRRPLVLLPCGLASLRLDFSEAARDGQVWISTGPGNTFRKAHWTC